TAPAPWLLDTLPGAPEPIARAITRCLAKAPGERPRDVAELVRALRPFAPAWALPAAERVERLAPAGEPPATAPPPTSTSAPRPRPFARRHRAGPRSPDPRADHPPLGLARLAGPRAGARSRGRPRPADSIALAARQGRAFGCRPRCAASLALARGLGRGAP